MIFVLLEGPFVNFSKGTEIVIDILSASKITIKSS